MSAALHEITEPSRITADLESLAGIVDSALPGWTRTALGEDDVEGRQWVLRQMRAARLAEHDSAIIGLNIPTAMIFIPSVDGRSHCPEEFTATSDIIAGANALLNTIVRIDLGETTQSYRKGF
jgi:hypothetical protein